MSLPPQHGQPQDPQGGYVPPQPPTDLSQQPPPPAQHQPPPPPGQHQQPAPPPGQFQPEAPTGQFHQDVPTGQFQQPGPQFHPNGQPVYPPPGPQPQSFQDKVKSLPPKQLGIYAGIGGGGLIVLILILVIALSGGGPSDTVDNYLAEVADGDIIAAREYMCDPGDFITEEEIEKHQEEIDKSVEGMDWEIINEHVAGDEATVEVKITGTEDVADEGKLKLELRNGDWFVCSGDVSVDVG